MISAAKLSSAWAFACLLLAACGSQNEATPQTWPFHIQGKTMGTTYSVKVVDAQDSISAEDLKAELDRELDVINQAMSTYMDDSALSQFNRARVGEWQPVPGILMTVLGEARNIYVLSDGAFDPSIGPLVNLWGFGPDINPEFPADETIQSVKSLVDFSALEFDEGRHAIRKPHDMYIDLSAIAKGYAVDRLAELLSGKGLRHYLVEIGGELKGRGENAEGKPWRIAIEKPDPGQRAVHGVIEVKNMGMATSGDYRNFFEKDGRRYSHTIDPRTGYPVSHGLVSVTVLSKQAMTADALATAFMVMGPEAGLELAESEQIAAWFVQDSGGQLVDKLTPKMQSYRLN